MSLLSQKQRGKEWSKRELVQVKVALFLHNRFDVSNSRCCCFFCEITVLKVEKHVYHQQLAAAFMAGDGVFHQLETPKVGKPLPA